MVAEKFDPIKYGWFTVWTENLKVFLNKFVRNLEVRSMLKFVAFFVFAGTEFPKSLYFFVRKLGKSTL